MSEISVRSGAWILVGDGRRALFLYNNGDATSPDFRVVDARVETNPPTREQGADRPGRAFASVGGARSAVGDSDWHELQEEHFAHEIAARINKSAERGLFQEIVIVAPPRTLGEIRKALSAKAAGLVTGELAKDLTRHPLREIEKALSRG